MRVDDVFELSLEEVSLTDQSGAEPLLIEGEYTGAVSVGAIPRERIAFGEEASEKVLVE